MNSFMNFLKWLFASPTPIIAIASAFIAYLAYNHQRKLNKKKHALSIAERYGKEIIPRLRYISCILNIVGCSPFIAEFNNPVDFTEQELTDYLKRKDSNILKFKDHINSVKVADLNNAYLQSGSNPYISERHNYLVKAGTIDETVLGDAFVKFILDLLNDLESFSSQFYYNIAEEELSYPMLHQTFLSHIKNLYYFIADKNRFDQDRYYQFIVWLYEKWSIRKAKRGKKLKSLIMKNEGKKRLH